MPTRAPPNVEFGIMATGIVERGTRRPLLGSAISEAARPISRLSIPLVFRRLMNPYSRRDGQGDS